MAKGTVTQDDLLSTIQMLATALEASIKGHPVPNAAHCFAAAEQFTAGTDFEFQRNLAR